jgi:hypothetical protein
VIASGNGLPNAKISWDTLPKKLQILIVVLAAIAVAILCWSGWEFANHVPTHGWIFLAMLAFLTFPFFINLPQIETNIFFGETYLMAIAISYGTSTCVISTAIYALLCLLSSKSFKPFQFIFGLSVLVCDAFLYSVAFKLIKPVNMHSFGDYLLPAYAMALVSFLFSSITTAVAVSWRHESRISSQWAKGYILLVWNTIIAACGAACIAVGLPYNKYVPLVFAPVISILWWWTKGPVAKLIRMRQG